MAYIITEPAIKNLDHELDEIRIRSLKHLEGKILQAFHQNATIEMHSGKLVSRLINWFNKKPLLEIETVLNLILSILRSEHVHETVHFLKKCVLEKEMNKIYEIVKSSLYKKIVLDIKKILENYEELEKYNGTSSPSNDEYEQSWSTPSIPDLNQLNILSNSISSCTFEENGLIFFKTAVDDYPAEYFLQPPYIFKNMVKLYLKEKSFAKIIISNFIYLSKAIVCRSQKRKLSELYEKKNIPVNSKTQITIPRFCIEILKICIEQLKRFSESTDQNEIFYAYQLIMCIFDIMKLDEYKKNTNMITLKSFLIDLGILARFYRQERNNRIYRIQYILTISLIAKLVQQENIHRRSNNNIYSFCRNTEAADIKSSEIWYFELQSAILDFPIRNLYPCIYNEIEKAIETDDRKRPQLQAVLKCQEILNPAVEILRKSEVKSDAEFILLAFKALDTLSVQISLSFVLKLIRTIARSMHLFDDNSNLKAVSEEIMLRLLSHENFNIKRATYKEISNNMKQSFEDLMNGHSNIQNLNSHFERSQQSTLGLPLTSEIISEIICFGYCHQNIGIKKDAEVILSLILKGKDVLKTNWKNILQNLIPNFPLLQSLANSKETFGELILQLFDPDPDNDIGLGRCEIFKGNLRFLFSPDLNIRAEAITRLAYILLTDPTKDEFLPNVDKIFHIIPNNLCYIQVPRDPEKIFFGGLYDCTTIPTLLELLKSNDVNPNARKTCLMQLNVLCQDIDLNKMFFKERGWFLQALQNALKKDAADYPDSAIPAIGILSKIILCNPIFRNEVSEESSIYELLLRALFFYYKDITLRQDAATALFLLLYNHHIIGIEKKVSVPIILEKINLPLKCDFHWQESSFKNISRFEEVFLELSKSDTNYNTSMSTKTFLNKTSSENEQFSSTPLSHRSEPIYSVVKERQSNEFNTFLQFIRFSFSTLWFSDFKTMYKEIQSINSNVDNVTLDYSGCFENENGVIEFSDILDNLKINLEDIRLIKITAPQENLKEFLKKIANAASEIDFLNNLAQLRFCLFLGSHNILDGKQIITIFRRILTVIPNGTKDYNIFHNVLELFDYLIKLENEIIVCWILKELSEESCVILQMLKVQYELPINLYHAICKFLETLIRFCATNDNNKRQELVSFENEKNCYLFNKLFVYLIPITEECFHKKYLDQVKSLLNLLQIITERKYFDKTLGFAINVIKKMIFFVRTLKLLTQSGNKFTHLNKNCLLIVMNLMSTLDEVILDENHIKLLSGLCSHEDFEIRALAWSILTKIALNLEGSSIIVKELTYLPGGFHACCLSTLLDSNEIPVVRFAAGMLFANLLSHKVCDSNGIHLHLSVIPLCVELEPSQQNDGLDLIKKMFSKFKNLDITTSGIMIAFCRILSNFISLCPQNAAEEFDNEPFMIRIFSIIKLIPSCITNESLCLLSEICFLINQLYTFKDVRSIMKHLCSDYNFRVALIQLLNLKHFESENTHLLVNVMHTLKLLINTVSFEIICEIFSCNGASNIIEIIIYGLEENNNLDLQNICLALLITLLVKSDRISTEKYKTISVIFDSTKFTNNLNQISYGSEKIFHNARLLFNNIFQKKKGGQLLQKTLVCETLAMLLRTSAKARKIAKDENFLTVVLEQINCIFENISITCGEFIRKYGDSKKDAVLQELTILYSIILHWFCSDSLTNESEIEKLSKMALHTWQSINQSESLREIFLKTLAVVSENSLQVCKQFAASITSFSNSIVQVTSKMVIAETNKIRHTNIDFGILELGLGILMNCCHCIEGRILLTKLNLLDTIGNLHPIDMKVQKSWNTVTIYWLEFWNIFSRYQEGAVIKHLDILCSLIIKTRNKIRLLCLKILRNITFQAYRADILSSQYFQNIIKEILENGNVQEQFIVIPILWKFIAENRLAKHTIKNWDVPIRLKNIQREIQKNDEENDLNSIIEIVLDILK